MPLNSNAMNGFVQRNKKLLNFTVHDINKTASLVHVDVDKLDILQPSLEL